MKQHIYNNTSIIIGENSLDNWYIISKYTKINDEYIWIHLNSFSSPHVIILDNHLNIDTIKYSCELCQKNSKYKNMKDIKFCMTRLKNIMKAESTGEVIFRSNRKVNIFNLNQNHRF